MGQVFVLDDHAFRWTLTAEANPSKHREALVLLIRLWEREHILAFTTGVLQTYYNQARARDLRDLAGRPKISFALLNNFLQTDGRNEICNDEDLAGIRGEEVIPRDKRIFVRLALRYSAILVAENQRLRQRIRSEPFATHHSLQALSVGDAIRFIERQR